MHMFEQFLQQRYFPFYHAVNQLMPSSLLFKLLKVGKIKATSLNDV